MFEEMFEDWKVAGRVTQVIVAFGASLVLACVAALVWVVLHTPLMIRVENRCAELGYSDFVVTWNGRGYCKTRRDLRDVVVPWESAPCIREDWRSVVPAPFPDDPPENKPR